MGYFRRRSPWACSRTEAPLAQCAPRLNGLSQPGSCPTQTPLSTSARTVQPTEQCVHTDRIVSIAPPVAASARLTVPAESAPIAARPPAARPDRVRNVRRSTACSATLWITGIKRERIAVPLRVFLSMFCFSFCSCAVADPAGSESAGLVVRPDVIRLDVACSSALRHGGEGGHRCGARRCCCRTSGGCKLQKAAPILTDLFGFRLFPHENFLLLFLPCGPAQWIRAVSPAARLIPPCGRPVPRFPGTAFRLPRRVRRNLRCGHSPDPRKNVPPTVRYASRRNGAGVQEERERRGRL